MYAIKYIPDGGQESDVDINKYLKVAFRPVIPATSKAVRNVQLGDGTTYYEETDTFLDKAFSITCGFCANEEDEWLAMARIIQTYFYKTSGRLYLLDDDMESFWIVKNLTVSIGGRALGVMSSVTLNVVALPFQYISRYYDSEYTVNVESSSRTEQMIHNPYESSSPLYRLYYANSNEDVKVTNSNGGASIIEKPFVSVTSGKTVRYLEVDPSEYTLKQVYTDGSSAYCNKLLKGRFDAFLISNGHVTIGFEPSASVGFKCDIFRRFCKI